MIKLSVVISAYNEEKKIENCLKSVKDLANEIIFIDNFSTDKTVSLARKYTSKIYKRENNLMLNVNKNFGFTKATGDWILCLDADERVTPELSQEIRDLLDSNVDGKLSIEGYWIPRKNIIFGKWIQSEMWWPDYQLRLFKKNRGKFPEKHVHEYIEINGKTERLKEAMIHENYSTVSQYLYKMDKIYTENEVDKIIASGQRLNWINAIRFPVNDFLKTFFAQKGYKDGLHGLVLSLLQAFYSEIIFVKIWEKNGFKEENPKDFLKLIELELKKIKKELKYWFMSSYINESKSILKKLYFRISRKIFV